MVSSDSFGRLVEDLRHLPGIGRKSAERLAFHILTMPIESVKQLSEDMYEARSRIRACKVCGTLTEDDVCPVCADPARDHGTICVVKEVQDMNAIEKTGQYRGVYHVLGGSISPAEGVFPADINIASLLERVAQGSIQEVILANSTDVPGQATASYLQDELKPFGVLVSRIAYGVPVGTSLQYADEVTLAKALEGRRGMESS